MSFEQPSSERLPETRKEEKIEEREQALEPVTLEDMIRYSEIKKYEFQKLIIRRALPEHPGWQKVRKELEPIERKAIAEKEKLTGPTLDRRGFLTDKERQNNHIDFLKKWDQLDEEEQFKRLNRVGNELAKMHPSTEEERAEMRDRIALQDKAAPNYFRIMKEVKPLSSKEDKKWEELLQKYESKGLPSFSRKELYKIEELQDKGQLEMETLMGPHFADFEVLASSSLRKHYLAFIESWNNLAPEEQRERLERARVIAERLERERQVSVGVGPADPLPRRRIFDKVRKATKAKEVRT